MADITPREDDAGYETLQISRQALKALPRIEGLQSGPLSPLARMQSPAGSADAEALIAAWEPLDDTWKWAVPALLDPHRIIALVMGDGNTSVIGQYLFPDADAYGPGFNVNVGEESVRLTGPLSLGLLHVGLYAGLVLEDVTEVEPFRVDLAADHFWVLMACLDAYRAVALALRLQRSGGEPRGVRIAGIAKSWSDGISSFNPGWAVSLFSLLVPDQVPRDLPERLPRLLPEMNRKGHLQEFADPGGTLYTPPEALSPLLWGPTTAFSFGLATQRLAEPLTAESTVLGGWRTPGGVWLADLSDMKNGKVSLALTGPTLAEEIIDEILGDDSLAPPWEEFTMDTPYTRDVLAPRLRAIPAADEHAAAGVSSSPGSCARCGEPLREGARFCRGCGSELPAAETVVADVRLIFCPGCGNRLREGARFCRECGRRL